MRAPAAYLMRSASLIRDLDPSIQVPATELVKHAYAIGIPIVIASGRRTLAEQIALYNQGRRSPGAIVTNIKPGASLHEGGLAFDVAPLDPHAASGMGDVIVPWPDDPAFWRILGRVGESLDLLWGGRFPKPDFPHFQAKVRRAATARLARGSIILPGKELRGRGRTPWVYLSTSERDALSWAAARASRDGFAVASDSHDPFATRTTIPLYAYRVEPMALELAPRGFYRCRRSRVLELALEKSP